MKYWLVKTEPETYSWDDLCKKEKDVWDGVRNYQARNYLNNMLPGDPVYIYHSGKRREIVGLAEVVSGPFKDPTDSGGKGWIAVSLKPKQILPRSVSLEDIKATEMLQDMPLLKQSRLSVMPLSTMEFNAILNLGGI